MKALLIDFNNDISSIGVRYISSYLKKGGHEIYILFLPLDARKDSLASYRFTKFENEDEIKEIKNLVKSIGPELIGISLMTHFFDRAVNLTKILKNEFKIPMIWGGVHASISPAECLNHADIVCVGEGEEAVLDLANKIENKKDYFSTKSLWFKQNGKTIKNPVRPLAEDLDKYPFPDYELENQYILHKSKVEKMNLNLFKIYSSDYLSSKGTYRIICSRGCPFRCTYCYNSIFWNLYPNKGKYNRRRSVENIIKELEWVKNNIKFIDFVRIMDDSFIATSEEWVTNFCGEYKKRINLPISCLVNPQTINQKKVDLLWSAGLKHVQMGIESSERVNRDVYKRSTTDDQIIQVTKILNSKKGLICDYDLIVDNPYETREDKINKIKLFLKVPKPYILGLYSLILYPHSPLYEMAKKDGKLYSKNTEYSKNMSSIGKEYLNTLLLLTPYLPHFMTRYFLEKNDIFHSFLLNSIKHLMYGVVFKLPPPIKKIIKNIFSAIYSIQRKKV